MIGKVLSGISISRIKYDPQIAAFLAPRPPAGAAIVVASGVRPSVREISTLKASTGKRF